MNGRAWAPPASTCSTGVSTSMKPWPCEGAPEAGDHRVADLEVAAGLLVDDEVGVALAEPGVGVGEAVPLVGHRPHAFDSSSSDSTFTTELALAGGHHRAVDTHPVAEVELADRGEGLVADDGLRDEQLDLAGAVAHGGEDQLALLAQEQDPAGHLRRGPRSRCRARARRAPSRISARVWLRSKRYGYGSTPCVAQLVDLGQAPGRLGGAVRCPVRSRLRRLVGTRRRRGGLDGLVRSVTHSRQTVSGRGAADSDDFGGGTVTLREDRSADPDRRSPGRCLWPSPRSRRRAPVLLRRGSKRCRCRRRGRRPRCASRPPSTSCRSTNAGR